MKSARQKIAAFYVAVFGVTHLLAALYRLHGGSWNSLDSFIVANVAMLIPGLTAIVFVRWMFHQPLKEVLGLRLRPNRWWLVAWLLAPALMLLTLGVSLLQPGTSFDPTMSGLGERLGFSAVDAARLRGQVGFLGSPRSPPSLPRAWWWAPRWGSSVRLARSSPGAVSFTMSSSHSGSGAVPS